MGTQTPELVIEHILQYLPVNGRLSTRLISSIWNSVVMRRFRNEPHRAVLRGMADFKNFLEVFNHAQGGVPIKKYIMSPTAATEKDFLAFAELIGPHITELTADCYETGGGIVWLRKNWQTADRSQPKPNGTIEFFSRLDRLLQHTPNLEYLGIMCLFYKVPFDCRLSICHLPKLRIFARVPEDIDCVCSAWCDSLVEQAPLLQGAKEVQADKFIMDGRNFNLLEPQFVNGYPIPNGYTITITDNEDLEYLEKNLKKETDYPVTLQIDYFPTSMENYQLPFHRFCTVSILYYEEDTINHPTLYFHNSHFPALRCLYINIYTDRQGGYPFQNCVLPTVEDLTIAVRMDSCDGWNLSGIFPNVRELTIYFRVVPPQFQIRDLLQSFQGSDTLETLVLEDYYRRNTTSPLPSTHWEEMLGLGSNHICEQRKFLGFFRRVQTNCKIPNCRRGQGLFFPALKGIFLDHLELDKFLPLLIRSNWNLNFPVLQKLSLSGYKSNDYCPSDTPNVEDYKLILESMVDDFKLEIAS